MSGNSRDNQGPTRLPPASETYPKAFALLNKMTDQLHLWIDFAKVPVLSTALGFVQVALAVRSWNIFRSIKVLLETSHWEDALILTRSLFELLLNTEEVHREKLAAEEKARRFLLYNELQRYHEARADRQYMIDTGRLAKGDDILRRLDSAAENLFAIFRRKNRKGQPHWMAYWCGKNVYELAQQSRNPIRVGQYRVLYSYASSFAHSSPQSVMSTHAQGKDWEEIEKAWAATEEQQTQAALSYSVVFLLETLFYVGAVFPDYNALWCFEVLADLYRLFGLKPPPMPPEVETAFNQWIKSRNSTNSQPRQPHD